jgi:single-strand DNA-binding protein
MASVNKIILIGRIGQDPEVRHIPGVETKVVNVSLATSEKYTDRQGNQVENTEWHTLEMWGNQAEIAEKYLTKGSLLYVEGKLKTEKWEKEGHKFQRHKVRVSSFTMLGGKPTEAAQETTYDNREPYGAPPNQSSGNGPDPVFQEQADDDLPF